MHKKSYGFLLVLFLFLLCLPTKSIHAGTNSTVNTTRTNTAEIKINGSNRYKTFRLTPEVYNQANSDLSDLRIKGKENIPFFIHSSLPVEKNQEASYPMQAAEAFIKDESLYYDFRIESIENRDSIASSISFVTDDKAFAKAVDLYGSYDGINWEWICRDNLYHVEGKEKLEIRFPSLLKYTHMRLKLPLSLAAERIRLEAVLRLNVSVREESYFLESFSPPYELSHKDGTTEIKIAGLKNLKLNSIEIETDSIFQRRVQSDFGSKELYNLPFGDSVYTDTVLPFKHSQPKEEYFVLSIIDNDDKPIEIKGIQVSYFADELVFQSDDDQVVLEFGEDENKKAPLYDIASYKEEVLKEAIDRLEIGDIHYGQAPQPKKTFDYKLPFNLTLIMVSVILAFILIRKMR